MVDRSTIPSEPVEIPTFLAWVEAQGDGRFELFDGRPVAMAPERAAHVRAKTERWSRLRDAIRRDRLPFEALIDGLGVAIGSRNAFVPDVLIQCGPPIGGDVQLAPSPVLVAEVTSPSTSRVDAIRKLTGYFEVPAIQHYLILDLERAVTIHYRRQGDATLATKIHRQGAIRLDPPGPALDLDGLFG